MIDVDEPGAVTPDFLALEVGERLVVAHRLLGDRQNDLRRAPLQHELAEILALRLQQQGVLERTGHHNGAAADSRLQRLCPARKVGNLDFQTSSLK